MSEAPGRRPPSTAAGDPPPAAVRGAALGPGAGGDPPPAAAFGDPPPLALALAARPWHVVVAALAAGLASSQAAAPVGLAAAAALLACLAYARAPGVAVLAAAALLAGNAAGAARLDAIDGRPGAIDDGRVLSTRAHLLTGARVTAFGASAEARIADGSLAGTRVLLRLEGRGPTADPGRGGVLPAGAAVGDELALSGTLRRPAAESDAGFDFAAHLRRRGIAAELLVERVRLTGARRGGIAGALDAVRRRAETAVTAGLPAGDAALALGMVLGEDEQIDSATRDDWRDAGLSHLLAVSGQNVMLLMALALPLLVAAGLGPRGRAVALLGLVALYVPLAGAGPSLQRAGVMGAAGVAAMTLSRPSSRWYALLLAAAVTLALNPRACADPGWQLSFVAVAGILAAGRPLAARLRRIGEELAPQRRASAPRGGGPQGRTGGPRAGGPERRTGRLRRALRDGLCDGVAITVAATVATAPLVAYHFGSVPVAGLVANLLALPAVAPAMWLGMVKAALGVVGPLLPGGDRLAELLGPATHVPIAYLDHLAERCATLAGGRLRLPLDSAASVVAAYAAMTALLYAPRLARTATKRARVGTGAAGRAGARACRGRATGARRRATVLPWVPIRSPRQYGLRPGALELAAAWRRGPRSLRAGIAALGATIVTLVAGAVLAVPAPPEALTVRFLDIGQGDATLIQDGAGAAVLFDGGPPEARVYRMLRAAGVRRLDLVVATHQSRDHQGGLREVLERIPTSLLLENSDGTRDRDFRHLLAAADARGIRRVRARAGQHLRVGRLDIEVLSPAPLPPGSARPEDPNPRGVAAIVSSGDFDLWLSADAESDAILPLPLRPVDALKVSHHGSEDPGLPEVLDRLRPTVAAIEVGAGNSYGHPTPETLAALRAAVPHVYRTDRDGTVTLTVRDGQTAIKTER